MLLSGYAARPPWAVAGVDYFVGYPSGTILKDPATIDIDGVSFDAAHGIVHVTANNVTLDGYDFSKAGGYGIVVEPGVSDTVIQNSNFRVGPKHLIPINAGVQVGNLTVQYNTVDGGGSQDGAVWALVNYNGSGTFVAKFNGFFDAPGDAIDFNAGTMQTVVKYNLFANLGTIPGSHPDAVQYVQVHSTHMVEAFNTIYQPNLGGMQGIQLEAQLRSTLNNADLQNNVIVAKGPGIRMSYSIAIGQDREPGNTVDSVLVGHNYIDFSGAYGPVYLPPSGTNLAFVDNVNMQTGTRIAPPSGTTPSNVVQVTAAPPIGSAEPGSKIDLTLRLNEIALVAGLPTLVLNTGGVAEFNGGSGTDTLHFAYTGAKTDKTVASLAASALILPAGSSVRDLAGNDLKFAAVTKDFPALAAKTGAR
jgi:hypothetical protein